MPRGPARETALIVSVGVCVAAYSLMLPQVHVVLEENKVTNVNPLNAVLVPSGLADWIPKLVHSAQ